ncbi:MAG TPA: HAD family hydrolase [Vicinamibacterales bacterium]|nr:HAD family hydrolase [Vicinamibacterales bacterium]
MSVPAVFLDRDGTLIEEAGYLDRLDRLRFFPWTIDSVRLLNRAGFKVVVITNQSGVGRGLIDEAFVEATHRELIARLEAAGARIDGLYYCPHLPDAEIKTYRIRCDCRKPATGMFRRAIEALGIDPECSFAVGDRWYDLEPAVALGGRGVLVRTGYGVSALARPSARVTPAHVANNLMEATTWILRQRGC